MLLEGKNISFQYKRGSWILQDVDISIESGEIVGLTAPSGYGKSTLGRILAGYERPQKGSVKLNREDIPKNGYNPVQLIFQHPEKAVNSRWHMRDILKEGWEPDDKLLRSLGVEKDWLNRWPNELSGGELQRFCVARALGPQTQFLIADEMTTMLDAITQAQIWHIVLEVARKQNLGVLVISHEKHLIDRLCDRVIDLTTINQINV